MMTFIRNKLLRKRSLLYLAVVCLTGCASFNPVQDSASYDSQQNDDTQTSDGTPYAIGQYLDQIRVARNTSHEKQVTQQQ